MYDKIGKLSMQSMIKTNSGKLIAIIASNIFSIEEGLANFPNTLMCPFLSIVCYIYLGLLVGWWYCLGVFIFWIFSLAFAQLLSMCVSKVKLKEAIFNDERIKLITDIIVGIRTIKCYTWEDKYYEKVKTVRDH
jgi:ABC-type multidrug transport system fused ATPase/permease subunit